MIMKLELLHLVCKSLNKKDKRLRSSILFKWKNYMYVIDTGLSLLEISHRSKDFIEIMDKATSLEEFKLEI